MTPLALYRAQVARTERVALWVLCVIALVAGVMAG